MLGRCSPCKGGSPWGGGVLLELGGFPCQGGLLSGRSPCWGGLLAGGSPCQGVSCQGGLPAGGVSLPGGFSLLETPSPVDRITDTSKNITLATTSLRPVIICILRARSHRAKTETRVTKIKEYFSSDICRCEWTLTRDVTANEKLKQMQTIGLNEPLDFYYRPPTEWRR